MGGMKKTTLYLPDELKAELERAAREDRRSEADVIRSAVAVALDARRPRKPRLAVAESGDPDLAGHLDDALDGFGSG